MKLEKIAKNRISPDFLFYGFSYFHSWTYSELILLILGRRPETDFLAGRLDRNHSFTVGPSQQIVALKKLFLC